LAILFETNNRLSPGFGEQKTFVFHPAGDRALSEVGRTPPPPSGGRQLRDARFAHRSAARSGKIGDCTWRPAGNNPAPQCSVGTRLVARPDGEPKLEAAKAAGISVGVTGWRLSKGNAKRRAGSFCYFLLPKSRRQ
jgi:hypothetical protein